jgi:hypothetical protein
VLLRLIRYGGLHSFDRVRMSPTAPTYDIFSGTDDRDAIWQCSVEGLWNAITEMEKRAAEKPGKYFVYFTTNQTVVARIETEEPQTGIKTA